MKLSQQYPKKRALITGGASGIGRGIALELAADGWRVAIADIHQKRLVETAAQIVSRGGQPLIVPLDVRSAAQNDDAARRLEETWGGVDVVFLNAGIASVGDFADLSLEEWERCLDINLRGVIHGARSFVPLLQRQKSGHLVFTASFAGMVTMPQMAAYNTAKAGVIALAETLHKELGGWGIQVSVVCPTAVQTNITESFEPTQSAVSRSLFKALKEAQMTGSQAAALILRKVETRRLYVIIQTDAHLLWRVKRLLPESFSSLISWMYLKRLWLFAAAD